MWILRPTLKNHSFQYTTWQEINTKSELLTPMLRAPSGGFIRFSRSALQFMVLKNGWSIMALVSPNAPSHLCGFFARNWEKQKIINFHFTHSYYLCPTWVLQVCKHNWYRSCTCTGQARDFHHSINLTSAGTPLQCVTFVTFVQSTNNGLLHTSINN